MKVIMQGMRRSGTTIVYDALSQDPRFTCWYEPLAAGIKPAVGGGSGAQLEDLFAQLRTARQKFVQMQNIDNIEIFNHGAPKNAALEFEKELPDVVRRYLGFLFQQSVNVLTKFTRAYRKVEVIHRICPDALFVHLVRDPRAVVSSYLFGKNQRNKHKFTSEEMYFDRRSSASAWSSRPISDLVISHSQFTTKIQPSDLERILLIWNYTFLETQSGALKAFGDNHIQIKHEDFCADPNHELTKIYDFFGEEMPSCVSEWSTNNVKPSGSPYLADDSRWMEAFTRLGMRDTIEDTGYS